MVLKCQRPPLLLPHDNNNDQPGYLLHLSLQSWHHCICFGGPRFGESADLKKKGKKRGGKGFLAVCASLYWLHILCSPHRVVMPTRLSLSQRNITVSYNRRGWGVGGRKRGTTFLAESSRRLMAASLLKTSNNKQSLHKRVWLVLLCWHDRTLCCCFFGCCCWWWWW